MVSSHLRFATGVCVLAAGLLMGCPGGAVAAADTASSDSAEQGDGGTNASAQDSATAPSLVGHVTDSLRETIRGVTSTFGSGRQPGRLPSTGASPKTELGSTGTNTSLVAPAANAVAPVTDVVAPVPNAIAPVADVTAPVADVTAPVADVTAPVADVTAPVAQVTAPVAQVVAPVAQMVAPVSDVIVAVQDVLTSVTNSVVPLTQVPADLLSLLMRGIAGMEPAAIGSALSDSAGLSPTADDASAVWQSPLVLQLAGIPSVPSLRENATAVAPVDVIAAFALDIHVGLSPPETAPSSSNGAGPRSFFRDVISKLTLPVAASLAALAAAALPGVGGLLILNAAGARIGYRQAKFGFSVHTSGIARFARPGPVGVVRSQSLVFVRPRASRGGKRLDNAA